LSHFFREGFIVDKVFSVDPS